MLQHGILDFGRDGWKVVASDLMAYYQYLNFIYVISTHRYETTTTISCLLLITSPLTFISCIVSTLVNLPVTNLVIFQTFYD
jgi:hypothetical protein